jgi:flagellin-like protein
MKKIWTMRKETDGVSPVIATILMVAITVVLAAVLYVMVLGIGGGSTDTTIVTMTKTSTATLYTYTVNGVSSKNPVPLTDVQAVIKNVSGTIVWQGAVSALSSTPNANGVAFNNAGATGVSAVLSAGDSFTLTRAGAAGFTIGAGISLTSADGTTTYASYTI